MRKPARMPKAARVLVAGLLSISYAVTAGALNLIFDDPLTSNSTVSGEAAKSVNGGSFVSNGWKVTSGSDQIMITLADLFGGSESGAIEVDMTNLDPFNQYSGDKHQFINLYSREDGSKLNWDQPGKAWWNLRGGRNYIENDGAGPGAGVKLLWAPAGLGSRHEVRLIHSKTDWDTSKTYTWRVEWTASDISLYLDGQKLHGVSTFGGRTEDLKYIFLGTDNVYTGFAGPVYTRLRVYGEGSGPANQAPVAYNGSASVAEGTSRSISLSYYDPDGPSPYTFTITQDPAHGSLVENGPTVTYTPTAGYTGSDSFKWKVTDGDGAVSNEATVTITVAGNQAPVASDRSVSVKQGGSVDITLDFTDPDGPTPHSFTITQEPSHGSRSGTGQAQTYTPNASYSGADSFKWKVADARGAESNLATVTITVTANQPPSAANQRAETVEDTPVEFRLQFSDADDPASGLVATVVDQPAHGSASIDGNTCTYTPDSGYSGTDAFTFKVSDGVSDSAPATVTITVYEDTDGDGLPNWWEAQYFDPAEPTVLDPTSADSDGDGIKDGNEDDDGDGCPNIDEYRLDRDPTVPDGGGGSAGLGCHLCRQTGVPLVLLLGLMACARRRSSAARAVLR